MRRRAFRRWFCCAPLGRAGSYLPTGLNVLQNIGWTIFEVLVIATAAQALVHGPLWVWKLASAAAATILALVGPIGFVRVWVKRVALWVVLASLAYLTWWTLHDARLGALWSQPGQGGLSFWQGVDLVVAMPVSWLPLAADYTRFSRSPRGAFWGSAVGCFIPNVWLYALGAILLLSRGLADAPSVITAIATGGVGAALALVALGIDETKEPFANIYSAAVSLQNVVPRAPQRLLILGIAAVATVGTLVIDLVNYQSFLLLLGSFFVPLFGVLLAQWIAGERDPFAAPAFRPGQIIAWLAGFCLYQWLAPVARARGSSLSTTRIPARERSAARCPASPSPSSCRSALRLRVVRALAVIGPLSRDRVHGRAERIGGPPWYAARALRAMQQEAMVVAKCGEPERRSYLRRLAALGLPVSLAAAGETTSFSFRYDADGNREMRVDAIGEPWSEGDEPERALRRVEWVHVAPLLRGDFGSRRSSRSGAVGVCCSTATGSSARASSARSPSTGTSTASSSATSRSSSSRRRRLPRSSAGASSRSCASSASRRWW